jgi:D-glycero-D-manno-heptose 1,7-bisphosphate phosphatase
MLNQAVILAGGKGSRLSGINLGLPKFLTPIGSKTIADLIFEEIYKTGINRILLLLGLGSSAILEYINKSEWHDLFEIEYIIENEELGTGGALLAATTKLDERFLLMCGDIYTRGSILNFIESSTEATNSILTRASEHIYDSNLVEIDEDGFLRSVKLKPHNAGDAFRNRALTGISIWTRTSLLELSTIQDEKKFDLDKEGISKVLNLGHQFKVVTATGIILDIGTPDRLKISRETEIEGTKATKAVFLDRDGVINVEKGHISSPEQLDLFPDLANFILKIRQAGYKIYVITNQPVIARGEATFKDLEGIHAKIDSYLGNHNTLIDEYFVCMHHPDSGFAGEVVTLKIDCDCRKPKPGLLVSAIQKHQIDIGKSVMIGNSKSDYLAANAVGVTYLNVGKREFSEALNFNSLTDILITFFKLQS